MTTARNPVRRTLAFASVHALQDGRDVGQEGVDGSASHGDHMDKVPKAVKEKIKAHSEYEKAQKKQRKLDDAKNQIKSKKLNLSHAADLAVAIAIVAACTATFFFPADDAVAWGNFFRVLLAT